MIAAAASEPENRVTVMSSIELWSQCESNPSIMRCTCEMAWLESPWIIVSCSTGNTYWTWRHCEVSWTVWTCAPGYR